MRVTCTFDILHRFKLQDPCTNHIAMSSETTRINTVPAQASAAVFQASAPVPADYLSVQGPNFDSELSLQDFLASYARIGFQANSLGKAIDIVNRMASHFP
jgi:hypothetical protein